MGTNKPLTLNERKQIEKLLKTSMSCSAISLTIGRGKNTVIFEVRRSGGREKYNAKDAQARSEARLKERYDGLSERNKGNKTPYITMNERIECLEMQIEILSQTLKELLNEKNHKL